MVYLIKYTFIPVLSDYYLNEDEAHDAESSDSSSITDVYLINEKVALGNKVFLDSHQVYGSNKNEVSHLWRIKSKPVDSTAVLEIPNSTEANFLADTEGEYEVELVVTNEHNEALSVANIIIGTVTTNELYSDPETPSIGVVPAIILGIAVAFATVVKAIACLVTFSC